MLGVGLARRRVSNPEKFLGETVRKLNRLRGQASDHVAITGAYDLYQSAKSTIVLSRQEEAKQNYRDLMAVYICANITDELKKERYQLTADQIDDYEMILKDILRDYALNNAHHDEVLKGDIFEMIYGNLRSMKSKFSVELGKPKGQAPIKTSAPLATPR